MGDSIFGWFFGTCAGFALFVILALSCVVLYETARWLVDDMN